MDKLYFGTAGVPISAREQTSFSGIARVEELGLGCMELEFVNGVRMSEKTADIVCAKAAELGIKLSAHGPYWINLNSKEEEKITASRERIMHAAKIAQRCGAQSVIFHAAFYHDDSPVKVLARVVNQLEKVRNEMDLLGLSVILRPEVTGKGSQFGSLDEVIEVSKSVQGVMPCVDFGHLHARSGGAYNSYDEFCAVLDQIGSGLGAGALQNVHFHVSGIDYGPKGERKHLILDDSDLNYRQLLEAFKAFDLRGLVICESPNIEDDALKLQQYYQGL